MALKDILEIIAADAEKEAEAILQAAEETYAARMEAAEVRAAQTRARILAEAQRAAQQEEARRLHRVKLENQRQQVQVQESAFLAAVRRAQEILAAARQRPDYEDILARLAAEALAHTDEPAIVVVHPDDVDLIRAILDTHHDQPQRVEAVETEEGLAPGVIVRSVNARVVTENTLDSRLQRSLPDLRPLLSDLLSEDQPGGRTPDERRD
ncbi:MAG: V-type ATP synthase subunit E [Chloroflexota bacterium]|nr:V-type ATP synthase subunit E [Chloroflexota bacterium]